MTEKAVPEQGLKGGHKKAKLLYLMKILLEKTDASHGITMPQITGFLEEYGIRAERKSIYDDLGILKAFGLDIRTRKSGTFEYYVENREFTLPELKMLADAVCFFAPVPPEAAAPLLEKLKKQCSIYQSAELHRPAIRIKAAGSGLGRFAEALEPIDRAIREKKELVFRCFRWEFAGGEKRRTLCEDGEAYTVSPCGLFQAENGFYLVAYHSAEQVFRYFRLDRMCDIRVAASERDPKAESPDSKREESVMEGVAADGGQKEKLRLEFQGDLLDAVIDRFGEDVEVKSAGKDKFRVTRTETVGPEFFSWLFRFGTGVKVLSPRHVAEQYREKARAVFKAYKK